MNPYGMNPYEGLREARYDAYRAWGEFTQPFCAFVRGVSNVIRWAPVIWDDYDWDYAPLTHVMEYKLRRMAKLFDGSGTHTNNKQQARQCLVCAILLQRIAEDDYLERDPEWAEYWGDGETILADKGGKGTRAALRAERSRKYDLYYLGKLIGKYLTRWWD